MVRAAAASVLILLILAATAAAHIKRIPHRCTTRIAPRLCAIHFHRDRTNHLRVAAHHHPIRYFWQAERHPVRRPRILTLWIHRQSHAKRLLSHYKHQARGRPWTSGAWYRAALCVHHGEGAWNANTGNGYEGGMQMDLSFQRAYGPEYLARYGTADNWPVADQLHAAYRAWQTRGWSPWPNTAAACGLLP